MRISLLMPLLPLFLNSCFDFNESSETKGLVGSSKNWAPWGSTKISVCWEPGGVFDDDVKTMLKNKSRAEYSRAGFDLTGWETCDAAGADIRIESQENSFLEYGYAKYTNAKIKNVESGIVLFLKMSRVRNTSFELRATIIHELGHAFGLLHEHERVGSDCDTWQSPQMDAIGIGPVDDDSIMSYCTADISDTLSEGDIRTIRFYNNLDRGAASPRALIQSSDKMGYFGGTEVRLDVRLENATQYKYAYNYEAGADDCISKLESGTIVSGADSIKISLPPTSADRQVFVCVVGGDGLSWQDESTATTAKFWSLGDIPKPLPISYYNGIVPSYMFEMEWVVDTELQLKLTVNEDDCQDPSGFSSFDNKTEEPSQFFTEDYANLEENFLCAVAIYEQRKSPVAVISLKDFGS